MTSLLRGAGAILVLAFAASAVTAQDSGMRLDGVGFLDACTRPAPDWIGFCHGYVQAVHDGVEVPGKSICVPTGQTRADLVGLVVTHLEREPELRELNAAAVVYAVLYRNFPCS